MEWDLAVTTAKSLIIAGFAAHMCVRTTTRAVLELGYRCMPVANSTVSRDLPHTCIGLMAPIDIRSLDTLC